MKQARNRMRNRNRPNQQTNRPNSSGLTARQYGFAPATGRIMDAAVRPSTANRSSGLPRRTISGIRRSDFHAPAVLRTPRYAIRAARKIGFIYIHTNCNRIRPRFARSPGRHVEAPDAMQVKPMMGAETVRSPRPRPSAGRDVNRKTFKSRWQMERSTSACAAKPPRPSHWLPPHSRPRRPRWPTIRQDRQRRTDDGRHLAPRQGQRERCAPRGRGNQCEGLTIGGKKITLQPRRAG